MRSASDIAPKKALWLGVLAALPIFFLFLSPLGEPIEDSVSLPIEFRVRRWIGREPALDPRLVIYGFGDSTLAALHQDDLQLADWTLVLQALGKNHPRSVFINKIFGTLRGVEDAPRFVEVVKSLPFPVVAGAFVVPKPIPGRHPFPLSAKRYAIESMGETARRLPVVMGTTYGPDRAISDALRIGHLGYANDGRFASFLRVEEASAIPAAPFLAVDGVSFNGELNVEGKRVPVDRKGRLLVDIVAPETLRTKVRTLGTLVQWAREGKPSGDLPKDAVVAILPALFTGAADSTVASPIGNIPGGFLMASILNSLLTGKWITVSSLGWLFLLLSSALGAWLAYTRRGLQLMVAGVGALVLLAFAGVISFSFLAYKTPWFFTMLAFVAPAFVVGAEKARSSERRQRRLRSALTGSVAPDVIKQIVTHASEHMLSPKQRELTVMFVDVVGFSKVAEQQSPEAAFSELQRLLGEITTTIHKHGGVIDRTLGDGMLAYFGYRYDGVEQNDHADRAVRCGLEIQRKIVSDIAVAGESRPVLPLRVGINTDQVYWGDLGNVERIDVTVIGNGVNFAKRLETACETHRVMMSASTLDRLSPEVRRDAHPLVRPIRIKHFKNLIEAYESDPFLENQALLRKVDALHRKFSGADRLAERWPMPEGREPRLASEVGDAMITNFSRGGFAVEMNKFPGRGTTLRLTLAPGQNALQTILYTERIFPLSVEVRWGRAIGADRFLLGLKILTLDSEQEDRLTEILRDYARQIGIAHAA